MWASRRIHDPASLRRIAGEVNFFAIYSRPGLDSDGMKNKHEGTTPMRERFRVVAYKPIHWLKRNLRPSWRKLRRLPHRINLFGARIAVRAFPFIAVEHDRLYPPDR